MKILYFFLLIIHVYSHIVYVEKDTEAVIHPTEDIHVDLCISSNPCTRTVWIITPPDTPRIQITNGPTGEYIEPMTDALGAPGLQIFHFECSGCKLGDEAKLKLELFMYGRDLPLETRYVVVKVLPIH